MTIKPAHRPSRVAHSAPRSIAWAAALVAIAGLATACNDAPRRARDVEPVIRDGPAVLRGTIGSESTIIGVDPVLVSGYGLVVGLNGTGGGPLPVQIQATMERELARGGIGKGGPLREGALAGKTPREVLRDPNVAVVIVEGVIPPGAPEGARFDVRVRTLPGSSVTSLEGGTLWSTVLRLGPVTPFGRMRTRDMAEAKGPVFINPFADPSGGGRAAPQVVQPNQPGAAPGAFQGPRDENAAPDAQEAAPTTAVVATPMPAAMLNDGISRTVGRALGGGVVTQPLKMVLRLDNPSHARAMSIVQAINSRFPPGPGDTGQTARGRDAAQVEITVPRAFRDKSEEFLQLLRFTQIDQAFPQEYAKRYADELRRQPALADELAWCLEALGRPAVAFTQGLYEDPELFPRLAALRAGARLGDPRATPHLLSMARSGAPGIRAEAISLLGGMGSDPQITLALRELANAQELEVRIAAYEALLQRGDAAVERFAMGSFIVDMLPAKDELIYVKQSGQPRIVLFGSGMRLRSPALASAWSDRLLLKVGDVGRELSASGEDVARVYYRDWRSERASQSRVDRSVLELIRFFARRPTSEDPTPGLAMTYSEVVGALYAIQKSGAVNAAFATERDRLLARLVEAQDLSMIEERPEDDEMRIDEAESRMKPLPRTAPAPSPAAIQGSLVVPLNPVIPEASKKPASGD
jgi:hypothetical protein